MKTGTIPDLVIRQAHPDDLPGITQLLESLHLPTSGVTDHIPHFFVAESKGTTIGTMGLELYGDTALLRSAGVSPEYQGMGLGDKMYGILLTYAQEFGIKELMLLTTTAEEYFRRRGFTTIERTAVNGAVTASREFQDACPTTATVMSKTL